MRVLPITSLFLACETVIAKVHFLGPFDNGACLQLLQSAVAWNASLLQDPELSLHSTSDKKEDIAVTNVACERLCEGNYSVPPNSGPRLLSWFLPVLLLITNIRYPENAGWKENTKIASFILSNPILANLILLLRLDARRDDDLSETLRPRTSYAYTSLIIYVWQFVSAFVQVIGGAPKPSGGMLSPALLLSWLIPMVLLTNAIGQEAFRDPDYEGDSSVLLWRLNHDFKNANLRLWELALRALLAIMPLCISVASAFRVLYTKPTFLTCRHFLILLIFGIWILNLVITAFGLLLRNFGNKRIRMDFYTIKDIFISALVFTLLISTTMGLFTSCYCLTGIIHSHGSLSSRKHGST